MEAQHGDNSIAASSEAEVLESESETQAPESAVAQESAEAASTSKEEDSSLANKAKSAFDTVAEQATSAAGQVGAAARDAVGASSSTASTSQQFSTNGPTKTVYVGNLFFDVREADLKREMSRAGQIVSTKIIHDQRGLSKR